MLNAHIMNYAILYINKYIPYVPRYFFSSFKIKMSDEEKNRQHLSYLVKQLTNTGTEEVNQERFKQLKSICKKSDYFILKLHEYIFKQFKKKHAEIRFNCFIICDEIFRKSHAFRCLILQDFKLLTDLVLGYPDKCLVEPVAVAKKLQKRAIEAIKEWSIKYGSSYPDIPRFMDYLILKRNVDFHFSAIMTPVEQFEARREEYEADQEKRKTISEVKNVFQAISESINADISVFSNCFNILIPHIDDFFIALPDDLETDSKDILSEKYSDNFLGSKVTENITADKEEVDGHVDLSENIKVDLSTIQEVHENKNNCDVIQNLIEVYKLINKKWLPEINKLEKSLKPHKEFEETLMNSLVKIKESLLHAVKRYKSINIVPMMASDESNIENSDGFDEDDEDDFIEIDTIVQSEPEQLDLNSVSTPFKSSKFPNSFESASLGYSDVAGPSGYKRKQNSVKTSKLVDQTPEGFSTDWKTPVAYVNPMAGLSQVCSALLQV